MSDFRSVVAAEKGFKLLKPPKWSEYLTFAWPPLAWDGSELPEVAVYDLENQPTTYDFLCFLMIAKTLGAKHVHFVYEGKIQDWKYPASQAWKRFGNILVPLCEMMGLPFTVGGKVHGFTCAYRWGHVNSLFKRLGRIEKLPLPDVEKKDHITITIRDTIKFKWKDSNRDAWLRFSRMLEGCGETVVVLDDSDTTGMILEPQKRLDIYASAKMNLGGSGGPLSLCLFSEAPYLILNLVPENQNSKDLINEFASQGFPVGSQFLFRNDAQKFIWRPDSYENIVESYKEHMRFIY